MLSHQIMGDTIGYGPYHPTTMRIGLPSMANTTETPPFVEMEEEGGDKSNGLHESLGHRFGEIRPAGWEEHSSTSRCEMA